MSPTQLRSGRRLWNPLGDTNLKCVRSANVAPLRCNNLWSYLCCWVFGVNLPMFPPLSSVGYLYIVLVRVWGTPTSNPGYGVKDGFDCLAFRVKAGFLVVRTTGYLHYVATPTYATVDSWNIGLEGPHVHGFIWRCQPKTYTLVVPITRS